MKKIEDIFPAALDAEAAAKCDGGDITVSGAIHKIRQMTSFAFVILRTGRSLIQGVYSSDNCDFDLSRLQEGSYVRVLGTVKAESRTENGFELIIRQITLLSSPAEQMPVSLSKKYLNVSLDVNLSLRPIVLRHPMQRAIFKLQEGIVSGFRNYMLANDFTEIHSPKIVKAGAEGGANLFKLDYFGQQAYLAQSPQFYKQMMAAVFDRVFEIGCVYRAEKHSTSRHLNEYIGLDFEMAYIDSMYDIMAVETGMLKAVIAELRKNYQHELGLLSVQLPTIDHIPALTFTEVKDILKGMGKASKLYYDLEPEEEEIICEYAKNTFGSEFLFITHYPSAKRPFYAMDDADSPEFALSFDLLFRGLEITTGGQRIHDYNMQVEKMKARGLDPEDFASYLMIHKHGMPPHGGLGIGLERLLMRILNLPNVRQTALFPRDLTRLEP